MKVQVRTAGEDDPVPAQFQLGMRNYEVKEIVDRWHGHEDLFFKVLADDGNLYILHEAGGVWDLASFRQAAE